MDGAAIPVAGQNRLAPRSPSNSVGWIFSPALRQAHVNHHRRTGPREYRANQLGMASVIGTCLRYRRAANESRHCCATATSFAFIALVRISCLSAAGHREKGDPTSLRVGTLRPLSDSPPTHSASSTCSTSIFAPA